MKHDTFPFSYPLLNSGSWPGLNFYVHGKAWTEWMRKEFSGVFGRKPNLYAREIVEGLYKNS